MGNSSTKSDGPLRPHVLRVTSDDKSDEGRSAVIMGPTGATGKYILSYLILSPEWKKITIIHRREVDLDDISKKTGITFTDEQKSKVTQHKVDMEKLCENDEAINTNVELFKDHEVTFCVLGTKRSIAKSAENFRKVDLYMVRDGAILSKKAGIPHFSLLTSKGSNANIWANDWKITHGLLYLKVKGDAEQAVIKEDFGRISIFRPGVLGREGESGGIMGKLPVRNLAAVMVYDAESDEINKNENEQDKKMVDEPMEKIEATPKDDGDADVDKTKDEDKDKVVEEEKTENVEVKQVKDIIIYESDDIDNVMVMAMKNFNGVCGESKMNLEVKEEPKVKDDKVEDAAKDKEVAVDDKEKDEDKDKVEEEERKKDDNDKTDGDKQENVEEQDKDKEKENEEEHPKYEVVEKPKEENVNEDEPKKEEVNEEIAKDDYVEVDKADASKEDLNGGGDE